MIAVKAMQNLIQKYLDYCAKHGWAPILTGVILGIFLIPVIPRVNAFVDNLASVIFVLIILLIGGFISLIASIFK